MSSVVGTWQLRSFEVLAENGTVVGRPMGPDPRGLLVYTADGWMSVHLSYGDRPHFAVDHQRGGSAEEKAAAMETYFSYAGTYEWSGDKMFHRITISSFPNWVGAEQWREPELNGDQLILRTPPVTRNGLVQRSTLIWRRV